jgi:hypothetical protein
MAQTFTATVKSTGETLTVYKLQNGNYYDYENMGANMPPSAQKAGKKEFDKTELILPKE